MVKRKQKWLDVELVKGEIPNIVGTFRKLKEINEKKIERAPEGTTPRKTYACVYCGRIYASAYKMIAHLGHCDQKKRFVKKMHEGLDYKVGNKIFHVHSSRIKLLKAAEGYETLFRTKVHNNEMTPEEAERMFFLFLKGAESTICVGSVSFTVRDKNPTPSPEITETDDDAGATTPPL